MMFKVVLLFLSALSADAWYGARNIIASLSGGARTTGTGYVSNLAQLPSSGASHDGWSDSYWPSYRGGIAYRWAGSKRGFGYHLYTLAELRKMPQSYLQRLSPAEKFDIVNLRYDYPTVRSEWRRTSPRAPRWTGLCHGWAPASMHYREPNPITVRSRDGISIPFGSSDVKGLLTFFAGTYGDVGQMRSAGIRCRGGSMASAGCADMNAGEFHVLLANALGRLQKSFIIDKDRGYQVWNQPLVSYTSSVQRLSSRAARVQTTISYLQETDEMWQAHGSVKQQETYQYTLSLDGGGNIVGGAFITHNRPDFSWALPNIQFRGYFSALRTIYQKSITGGAMAAAASTDLGDDDEDEEREDVDLPTSIDLEQEAGVFNMTFHKTGFAVRWTITGSNATHLTNATRHASGNIVVSFAHFGTEPDEEWVKIYEGVNCDGALVAVLHGSDGRGGALPEGNTTTTTTPSSSPPEPVIVHAAGACVVLVSSPSGMETTRARGFAASYRFV